MREPSLCNTIQAESQQYICLLAGALASSYKGEKAGNCQNKSFTPVGLTLEYYHLKKCSVWFRCWPERERENRKIFFSIFVWTALGQLVDPQYVSESIMRDGGSVFI